MAQSQHHAQLPKINIHYQPADPIISSNFSLYSPSVSRVRDADPDPDTSQMLPSERDPLLGGAGHGPTKKPFFRPRPLWLAPFVVIASIVRGMTLAPRVQVFTQLSCNAIYGHDVYDHTTLSIHSPKDFVIPHAFHIPFYSSLDPAGPHLDRHALDLASQNLDFSYHHQDKLLFAPNLTLSFLVNGSPSQDNDDDEPDPRAAPSKRCLSDPAVQAGAARLQTIMTTTMGALSALTTGWWGHFGERHGRTRVLAVATLGLFLTDLTFILVSTPHSIFAAHGHKLLIISPFIEGLLGGWTTLQGAASAYVSDCTSDGSRSHIFSRFQGVFFLGFSLGPALGAYIIRHPIIFGPPSHSSGSGSGSGTGPNMHNGAPTVTSVFYIAAMCSFVNLLLVLFVFPESIGKKKATAALLESAPVDVIAEVEVDDDDAEGKKKDYGFFTKFLSPLALFAPKKIPLPEGGYRRDWSLTLLGLALFGYLLSTGIFQIKYLYAEHVYGWGAEQLSYYISFVGAARALHLLVIMPYLITTFKPKPKPKASAYIPSSLHSHSHSVLTRSAPLHIPNPHATPNNNNSKKPKPTLSLLTKESQFDLTILRFSLLIDLASHTLVSLMAPDASQNLFVGFTLLSCFGGGAFPAMNSLALCIMQMQALAAARGKDGVNGNGGKGKGKEDDSASTGRLFGALAIVQAVAQMILGPMLFGTVYSLTVAKFPKAIFTLAAGIIVASILMVLLLRPDVALQVKQHRKASASARSRHEVEVERGRSRVSKDLGVGFYKSSGAGVGIDDGEGSSSGHGLTL